MCLNIGVLSHTFTSTIELSASWLRRLADLPLDLSITVYPCEEDPDAAPGP